MDCMSFRKLIPDYINDELDDNGLNEFLNHLETCDECREELEIHYIVMKGVEILDHKDGDYNLSAAFLNSVLESRRQMKRRKRILKLSYAADTAVFWSILLSSIVLIRLFLKG